MKKKLLSLLLAVAASVGTMYAAVVNGTCGDNLTWSLNTKDSTLTIDGTGEMTSHPWDQYSSYISRVILKDGVTTIYLGAFYGCSNLVSVSIPNSVNSIGNWVFYNTRLSSIELPNSVTSIGESAFYKCTRLTSITIPNGITSIGASLFRGCTALTSIEIPNSVKSIGNEAFYGCIGLTSVNLPNSVTSIGGSAFSGCTGLTSIEIPNEVTKIEEYTFSDCTSLKSVTIGNGVTSIGSDAFWSCEKLTSLTIGPNVTSIGGRAFLRCNIKEIHYSSTLDSWIQNKWSPYSISPYNSSFSYTLYIEGKLITDVVIPSTYTSLGDYTFYGCKLSSVTCLATTPPSIGSSTFSEKSMLLFVPGQSIETYQNALYWEEFTNIHAIGSMHFVQFLDWDGTLLSSAYVNVGSAATPPADPQREGYVFIGWDKDFSNITEDVIITAQYKNRFRVEFVDWDGTILKVDSVEYGKDATPPADPQREGYVFVGWDKEINYVTRDLIVTALYKDPTVQEIIRANTNMDVSGTIGGTISTNLRTGSSRKLDKGTYFGVTLAEGTFRTGDMIVIDIMVAADLGRCMLYGDSEGKDLIYSGKVEYSRENPSGTGEMRIVLPETINGKNSIFLWRENGNTQWNPTFSSIAIERSTVDILVTFCDWNGEILAVRSIESGETVIAPDDPIREGYTFIGWDKDFSNVTESMTVTAQYKIKQYKVEFVDWDGTVLKTENVNYNLAATPPSNPSREWYTFIGWDKDYSAITTDITVTAKYSEGQVLDYNITFTNSQDDSEISREAIQFKVPVPPIIAGFTFVNWEIVSGDIRDGFKVQAVYEANEPASSPAVYTNPSNPAQKLLRNGNVYILTDDARTYTITGQEVK